MIRLMDKILHDPKDPKLWELWYIPYNGSCRILSISSRNPLSFLLWPREIQAGSAKKEKAQDQGSSSRLGFRV